MPTWGDALAVVGAPFVRSRRLFRGSGQSLLGISGEIQDCHAAGRLAVASIKVPDDGTNLNTFWASIAADCANINVPFLLACNHEPATTSGAVEISIAAWHDAQYRLLSLAANNSKITPTIIFNGFAWNDNPPAGYQAGGGTNAWLPTSLINAWQAAGGIMAADFYDGGSLGSAPQTRVQNFSSWAGSRGLTRLGAGEVGTSDLTNMKLALAAINNNGFVFANWWNTAPNQDLVGDRLIAYRNAAAVSIIGTAVGFGADAGSSSSANTTATLPAITVAGYAIAMIGINSGSATVTSPPAGWTLLGSMLADGNISRAWLYGKPVTGADSGMAFAPALSAAGKWVIVGLYAPGAASVDALVSMVETTADLTLTTPTITPNDASELDVSIMYNRYSDTGAHSVTPSAGWTENADRATSTASGPWYGGHIMSRKVLDQWGVAQAPATATFATNARHLGWRLTMKAAY